MSIISNATKKWSSSVSLEFCYKWPWQKPFWSRGYQRAGESMRIGRRLAMQDTEELALLWAFHSGSGWGGMWRGDTEFLAKKLGKSRADKVSVWKIRNFFWGVSERSIIYPHLWHVLNFICGQALSYAGSLSESKCLGSPSWIEGYAEGWPMYCEHKTKNDASHCLQKEKCTGFSLRPLSALKCYDSVINLLNKLIVQTVFQEECLNYLWEQTFQVPSSIIKTSSPIEIIDAPIINLS